MKQNGRMLPTTICSRNWKNDRLPSARDCGKASPQLQSAIVTWSWMNARSALACKHRLAWVAKGIANMQSTILNDKQSPGSHPGVPSASAATDHQPAGSERIGTPPVAPPPDSREQLFNGGEVGPIQHVQVSTERIVRLNGILFDIDPANLSEGPLVPALSQDPDEFYELCVQRWLANHRVLEHAEVRASGTGLHAILWLDPPVEFGDQAERTRWCSITKVVQAVLPIDPCAPGITATTRALGSINSKCGRQVHLLKQGEKVPPSSVLELQDEMCTAPFKTMFQVLTGSDRLAPCPFCKKETLVALHYVGMCYGCGKQDYERLCGELFQPQK